MCGECCSSWNIPVETEKALQLLEKPWVQDRLKETHRHLTPMTDETYRIPLTDENVCVFLATDRRCMVEIHEGMALKPHECQRFPFAQVRLPDGSTWHETSAACKSISEKLLLAFQPIVPKMAPKPATPEDAHSDEPTQESQWANSSEAHDLTLAGLLELPPLLPEKIPYLGFSSFTQAQYEHYQAQIQNIFTEPELSPEAGLRSCHKLLHQLATTQNDHHPPTLTHTKGEPYPYSSSLANGSGFPRKGGGDLKSSKTESQFETSFAPLTVWLLTILFLRKPYRTLSWVSLLKGDVYQDVRIFGMAVDLRGVSRVPWNPAHNRHLNAFLFNLLQRKRMLALGSSLTSHLAMAGVASLLVQWYARALAWLQHNPEVSEGPDVSEENISNAIRLVERYYTGHQPRFLAFFSSRWQAELIAVLLYGI